MMMIVRRIILLTPSFTCIGVFKLIILLAFRVFFRSAHVFLSKWYFGCIFRMNSFTVLRRQNVCNVVTRNTTASYFLMRNRSAGDIAFIV